MNFSDFFHRIDKIQNRIHNIRSKKLQQFEKIYNAKFFQNHLNHKLGNYLPQKDKKNLKSSNLSKSILLESIQKNNAFNNKVHFLNSLSEKKISFNKISNLIKEASKIYKVPESLIKSVIKSESNYDVKAVSHAGAKGLMQLMPKTAKELGVNNIFDPKENIFAGTKYLKKLLNYFNGDLSLSLAAYNSGVSRVVKAKGIPNIEETKNYVREVIKNYQKMNQKILIDKKY